LPPSALEASERASIDIQIATAKRYPRSLEKFNKGAKAMATIDEETAESCLYRRPVGKKNGKEEFAEGMSVRMAEIVGANYGNLRVQSTLVEQTPRFVRARGMAIDLENNFASCSEVVESTVKTNGEPFSERMRMVVAKAALSKARRDATFQVVPRALARPVEAEVRRVLMGDSKTIERRRAAVLGWVSKLGIDVKRIWTALGINGEADLGPDQLETLTGIKTAIKDNEVTIDEAFPNAQPEIKKPLFKKPEPAKGEEDFDAVKTGTPVNPLPVDANKPALLKQLEDGLLACGKSEGYLITTAIEHEILPKNCPKTLAALTTDDLAKLVNVMELIK
jgi:hypothetical protein